MHCSITALPFEILDNVASYLNLEDFVNLKVTRKELFETLHGERISREAVKVRNRSYVLDSTSNSQGTSDSDQMI